MNNHINRRNALKRGLLGMGGLSLLPALSMAETAPNVQGDIVHTPLFREHTTTIEAKLLAKLNANENPYGPSPKALDALKDAAVQGNRYGWKTLFELVDLLAAKEGVKKENIMMGPGSSDLLEKFGLVMFMNGGNIVSADPSYMSMMNVARSVGATWKGVKLNDDWSHDLDAMENAIDTDTKLVYICNPNNPTGTVTDGDALYDFCERVSDKVPVFVDEAYIEFVEGGKTKSMAPLVAKGKNVIVARTFSKLHGMAGLRVGYVAAQEKTLEVIQKITRGGMGITNTSIAAALASFKDEAFLKASKKKNNEVRAFTFKKLQAMGFDPVPSHTSFMIFPQTDMEGKKFLEEMALKGVRVRSFEIYDQTWCRVSMGTKPEMEIFLDALGQVIG